MNQKSPVHAKAASSAPKSRWTTPLPGLGAPRPTARLVEGAPDVAFDGFVCLHQEGIRLHQLGDNDAALAFLEAALRAAPANAPAWSDLGVVYAAAGRFEPALDCYDKAIALDSDYAAALSNRGNALMALGRPLDALGSFDRALAVNPGFAVAANNRGAALRELGRFADALASFDQALAINPRYADAFNNRANTLVDLDCAEEALRDYDHALSINAGCAKTFNNRGNALFDLGRRDDALASYEAALALNPHSAEAHSNRGNVLRALKRCEEAALCYETALSIAPGNAEAHNNLGNALMDLGRPADALASYDAALALRPDHVQAFCNRAQALLGLKRAAEALASCEKALALNGACVEAHNGHGDALAMLNRQEEALESYDRAIALRPFDAVVHNNKGLALLQLGRVEEGQAFLEAAIEISPGSAQSYYNLALSKQFEVGDPTVRVMETLALECPAVDARERTYLHFALGKAFADIGDWARSFHYLSLGNVGKRKQTSYEEAQALAILERTRSTYTAELMGRHYGRGDASTIPIFVVGMPRSGTTLVEQILACHPEAHCAGEINDFEASVAELAGAVGHMVARPEAVLEMSSEDFCRLGANYVRRVRTAAPLARRIVNKMPENFRLAGLIALALPGARILHVRRDPVDTCVSCFSTLFVENLPYAYDLAELGRYWRAYEALMEGWRSVLPRGLMLDVVYEEVVADLEGQARRIVNHCGLDWDPRCLDFHRNGRSIRTASFAQVRRPLYGASVGRWRNYETYLGPLLEALFPAGRTGRCS
jgi:tetratricopeptide (TPR) repeat protein